MDELELHDCGTLRQLAIARTTILLPIFGFAIYCGYIEYDCAMSSSNRREFLDSSSGLRNFLSTHCAGR
ncbi:hypothetical protein RvY_04258 [Ramazzottius varieornatus]|uniref:Uncharacterized protein n=1 Tax=Ramazzottius varieornatus TaxID=947166 RepID=A0A1D1UUE3_RAMVA|nr:hypothetical protein RvY_04258 [Ramazzottius varieornatus]